MPSNPHPIAGGSKLRVRRRPRSSEEDKTRPSQDLVLHSGIHPELHPSTSRALVLRKAAYGTGELSFSRKISGQEKLSLLAKEMMTSAIRVPFRLDELLKRAESQLRAHLDEISNLKDKDFFCDDILATIGSRIESAPDRNGVRRPPIDDTRWVASVVGCRVHNVYLLAGAWRIVRNILRELEAMGLDDTDVCVQLGASEEIRARYLVLYDVITMLARMGQQRVANIAAATAHYAPYFVRRNQVSHNVEMEFDHYGNSPRKIREAHQSFIDAILLELVLPGSEYPPYVLIALLHDAVEECRKEEKRFSQALWDSVGDFSVTVEVLDLVEGPLLWADGKTWIRDTSVSSEFSDFLRVQALSDKASQDIESWTIYLKPLIETKEENVMKQLWYHINKSYQKVGGVGIDDLWSLRGDLKRLPQWSTYFIPGLNTGDSDSDEHALVLHKLAKHDSNKCSGKGRLRVENVADEEVVPTHVLEDDLCSIGKCLQIPALVTVSDDSDDDIPMSSSSEHLSEGDSESNYDPATDELLQDMLREALDTAMETDLLEYPQYQDYAEKPDNPFTRMFANLKDRYFSVDPALRANERSRNPFKARPPVTPGIRNAFETPKATARAANRAPGWDSESHKPLVRESMIRPTKPKSAQSGSAAHEENLPPLEPLDTPISRRTENTTTGEVADEDDVIQSTKKKVKKKKNHNKNQHTRTPPKSFLVQQSLSTSPNPSTTSNTVRDAQDRYSLNQPLLQNSQENPKHSKHPSEQQSMPVSPSLSMPSKKAKKPPAKRLLDPPSLQSSLGVLDPNLSQISLPLAHETTAQSARAYMQSGNLTTEKTKVKTRPAFAGSFFKVDNELKKPKAKTETKGLLSRMKKINLPKRIGDSMIRLISSTDGKTGAKKPMKWEEFLKVMRAMGFSYDPSTAGSSVRFDPPDPKDPSITFHKPHPDPTLQRSHLRDFGKRLKKTYGWNPEQFSSFGVKNDDEDN